MIMPFILNSFLETSSLKENESRSILRRIQESRINMAKNFTLDSYDELQKCLEEEMKILPKVFPEFANLPNLHINIHLLVHARTYGTLINTQVVDRGADQRLSQPCRGFATMSSNFRNLLTNWYITEDKVSNEQEPEENEEAISSPVDFITNIILKRSLSPLIYSQMGWYELVTYTMEESDDIFSKVYLHIGDVVTIHEEDSGEYKPRHSLEKNFPNINN
ncbi:hypothetical protein GLOIN_2v1790377 [Rhizophagus clarus]|uniref:Uncharacterized protein n=1 Tax=Rhizophagus clarus TaxID=94130 RepID=A0A8H3QPL8_9GLOM|nr:hypothetical protein GLOIN_2v1790377 [Rhizophagus clarus]